MAGLGTLAAAAAPSVIGSVAGAGASFGLSKLFGGGGSGASQALNVPTAPRIDAGGLSGQGGRIQSSRERRNLVGSLAATFPEQAGELAALRGQVTPGFGRLTESRLAQVEDVRRRSIGNLRDNLARRRVLGSSFAGDALTRAEAEFGRESDRVTAESFLEELSLNNQLLNQEFEARRGEFQTFVDELNLQAEVGTQLSSAASSQLQENARLRAELAIGEAQGRGSFLGQAIGPISSSIGSGVASIASGALSPGSSSGGFSTVTRNAAGNVL